MLVEISYSTRCNIFSHLIKYCSLNIFYYFIFFDSSTNYISHQLAFCVHISGTSIYFYFTFYTSSPFKQSCSPSPSNCHLQYINVWDRLKPDAGSWISLCQTSGCSHWHTSQACQSTPPGNPYFCCINSTTHLGATCTLAEDALNFTVHVIDKDVKQYWS